MNITASKGLMSLPKQSDAAAKALPEPATSLTKPHETLEVAKNRLKKASQEFESFITYYMLKTMRETTTSTTEEANPLSGGFGKETFTEMFDMELSKKMASNNGRSLSGMLYNSLERVIEAQYTGKKPDPVHFKDPLELHEPKSMPLNVSRSGSINQKLVVPVPENEATRQTPADLRDNAPHIYQQTVSIVPQVKVKPATYDRPVAIQPKLTAVNTEHELSAAANSPIKPKPSDQSHRLDDIIEKAAQDHGLDSALIKSVIDVESHGDPKAVSPAGAKGLMQLMDSVAQDYNVDNAFDPTQNITAGAAHLKRLINRFGDVKLGLAAYNAGPGNVKKYNGIPPFAETEQYVEKVLETYTRFKSAQTDSKVNSGTTDIDRE